MPLKEYPRSASGRREHVTTRHGGETFVEVANPVFLWTDFVDGDVNPRWRSQVNLGIQAGTNLVGYRQWRKRAWFTITVNSHYHQPPQTGFLQSQRHEGYFFIPLQGFGSGVLPSEGQADNLALSHYVKKIRKAQTTFQGGVFLGEIGRTVRMLKSPLRTLRGGFRDYLSALKKRRKVTGRPSAVKRHRRKVLEETWLEYSFGWVPLLNDVADATELLSTRLHPEVKNLFGVGTHEVAHHAAGNVVTDGLASPGLELRWREVKRVTVKYYGALALEQDGQFGQRRLGLDLSNFAPTAWELLPWSFLVDYFSNIGDIVSAATLCKEGLRWTMRTVIQESKAEMTSALPVANLTPNSFGWKTMSDFTPGWAESGDRRVERSPYFGSLVPGLRFEVPGLGSKWLNLLALSRTARRLTPFF